MIFYLVRNQLIMGFAGPVDVSHEAIHRAMELYDVKDKRNCFEKVLLMCQSWLKGMSEK